jgi:RimJ/RimL family protein N-acetyltransferase
MTSLSVRELQEQDIPSIVAYWLQATPEFLKGMGADPDKLPDEASWHQMLKQQVRTPYEEKQSYCTIWEIDGKAAGHCNVNKIVFGKEAYMHLHLWQKEGRQKGAGAQLVKLSLPHFFRNLQLKTVYCEPYALNPAPNKALEKAGFRFVKEYTTIPGSLNFEQSVHLWEMPEERFLALQA